MRGVYKIYFKNNKEKVYIGSSMNIKSRISNHISTLNNDKHLNSLLIYKRRLEIVHY